MPAIAKLTRLRIAPRKVREVVNLVRGKRCDKAVDLLTFCVKRASKPVSQLIKSAVANAKQGNPNLDFDDYVVSAIWVDEGMTLKRWRARAQGRAAPIMKRTSKVTVEVEEIQ
jgi:large subunit ribosomal protein L22